MSTVSLFVILKRRVLYIALYVTNLITELWNVTCHTESHSVTCHPTQVNAPRLIHSQ